jgi:hypothetical protein
MSTERRAKALIDIVEADRRERVEAILRDANHAARAQLRDAYLQARERVRAAFADERRLRDERVHGASANLQTKRRLTSQHHATALLAEAWRLLPGALVARWRALETRQQWIADVVAKACAVLARDRWSVEYAPDGGENDEATIRALVGEAAVALDFRREDAIRAGLRIRGAGTVVDGALGELTRDRTANAARLLACLERHEGSSDSP